MPITFGSINEGDDPKALPPGTMLRDVNCAMDKARRLIKRDGTDGLVKARLDSGSITAGARLLSRGADTGLTDGHTAFSYGTALAKWQPLDHISDLHVTRQPLADSTTSVGAVDIAISGDLLVTAYEAKYVVSTAECSLFVQVKSIATGETLFSTAEFSTAGTLPRILIHGTVAYLLYGHTTSIKATAFNLATMAIGATTTLISNGISGGTFDACLGTSSIGDVIYLAYLKGSGTDRVQMTSFAVPALTVEVAATPYVGTTSGSPSFQSFGIAYAPLAHRVYLLYGVTSGGGLTRLVTTDRDLGPLYGPFTVLAAASSHTAVVEHDANYPLIMYVNNDATGTSTTSNSLTTVLVNPVASNFRPHSQRITYGMFAPSKMWTAGGRWFAACNTYVVPYTGNAQIPLSSSVVVEIETDASVSGDDSSTHIHVATLENQTGWFRPFGRSMAQVALGADGATYVAAAYRNREFYSYGDPIPIGWNLYRVAVGGGDIFRQAVIGAGALCAGGAPAWFDGATSLPYGFSMAPEILSVTAGNHGGVILAGTYSYVATYAWRDANGVLHRSTPSPPKTGVTSGSNLTLDVMVSTASLSCKQRLAFASDVANPVMVELWRTSGIAGAGSHYRLTHEPTYNLLYNDPQAGDVTFRDIYDSASITGGTPAVPIATMPVLYTDLGELENVPPPAFITCITHRGRMVGIGPDLRTIWFSKDSTLDATLAPGFNEALTLAFASDKTALASLDEKLAVFGRATIDVVHNDGPADDGGGNSWLIQAVQTDVGCTNPRSVVASPLGVMFESPKGIETLGRDLNVTWTGKTVTDTLLAYPTITSAVLVASHSEIRFTCHNGETGIVLAWDYVMETWFTRTYADAADTDAADILFVDAALINGVYTMLTAGGQVYRETSDHHLDNGTEWVEREIVLAPISPGTPNGWCRIKDLTLMGTSETDHDLEVSFARDYATTYEQTKTYAADGPVTAIGPLEKARIALKVQKRQAVQIRIRDLTPSAGSLGTGAGPTIEALMLRVAVEPTNAKTSAGQQG